ncbi:cohesin subunit SA-2-like isoform X1 [Anneissia japonica]|uniref:cohesin subunit SA-2-like isoform X1 n=1 Tax=Anneissia japonica TaxID=1529436 RepID=UPI001425B211|nr:cohesin subunit SA-2-like isoform X1 [Anneissia japonica]XP_033127032.1 cohesin subunit SA-2-like isoform X1 [Anneissia japonica]
MPALRGKSGKAIPDDQSSTQGSEYLQSTASSHGDHSDESENEDGSKVKKKPTRGQFGGAKRGRGRRPRAETESIASNEPSTLFEIVRQGKGGSQTIVDEWIESYKTNRDTALLDLINFIIQSSGCKGVVTTDMYATLEHSDIIRRMTEEFDEESGDYPLIMTGIMYKKFKSNFCDFIVVLVRQCQYSILYDQYMMDNIISLLTGLSDSQVRAFRHTSTLAAMKLMTALVNVALNLSVNLDNTQRQHDAERQKQTSKRASERIEMLLGKRQEIIENIEEIQQMMNNIFKGIFVHRYRDTQPEIRAICMGEIGVWMKNYSEMFLSDSYLKYVGWTLHDKVGDVRLKCLVGLQNLYLVNDLALKLELFTNRFKDRIVAMTLDKETDVAVQAIKVVTLILKFNEDILSAEDCENVYQLVYSASRAVAQAAGEFLNERLFKRDDTDSAKSKRAASKRRSANAPLIKDLVQFFIESELHEHAAYLVDALWEVNDMGKDWDCMTELLLEEPGRGEEPLDDRQETALIEIMVCAVRQAAQGHPPVGRGSSKKILTAKEKKSVQDDKMKLSEHFIVKLPDLLSKYGMDSDKVANLLEIPQHFDVEIFTTSRLEKHLDSLLRQMRDIVEKHTESEVLEACAKTYESLLCEQYNTTPKVEVARTTLFDSLAERLARSFESFDATDEPHDNVIYALSSSLKRITTFYSCHDLTGWNLYEMIYVLIKQAPKRGDIPEDIYASAIACAHYAIMWYVNKLEDKNPDPDEINKLKKRVNDLIHLCAILLIDRNETVKQEAFTTIGDLLVVFSKQLGSDKAYSSLVYIANDNLQNLISDFIQEEVFVEEDDDDDDDDGDDSHKIEVLHKRRNLLASFCKLIVFNIIDMRNAAGIFKHYMKYYNDYGDIIKLTLAKSREINKISCARTLGLSLSQLFNEMKSEIGYADESRSIAQMNAIKELARRFSLTFGLDQIKTRDAVAALHREGIVFSLTPIEDRQNPGGPPPNIGYLDILSEFTAKLMKQDKKTVLAYLDKQLKSEMLEQTGDEWSALRAYRNSLMQGGDTSSDVSRPPRPPKRPKPGIKRKMALSGADDVEGRWVSREEQAQGARGGWKRRRTDEELTSQGRQQQQQEEESEDESNDEEDDFQEGQAIQVLPTARSTPKSPVLLTSRHLISKKTRQSRTNLSQIEPVQSGHARLKAPSARQNQVRSDRLKKYRIDETSPASVSPSTDSEFQPSEKRIRVSVTKPRRANLRRSRKTILHDIFPEEIPDIDQDSDSF